MSQHVMLIVEMIYAQVAVNLKATDQVLENAKTYLFVFAIMIKPEDVKLIRV